MCRMQYCVDKNIIWLHSLKQIYYCQFNIIIKLNTNNEHCIWVPLVVWDCTDEYSHTKKKTITECNWIKQARQINVLCAFSLQQHQHQFVQSSRLTACASVDKHSETRLKTVSNQQASKQTNQYIRWKDVSVACMKIFFILHFICIL